MRRPLVLTAGLVLALTTMPLVPAGATSTTVLPSDSEEHRPFADVSPGGPRAAMIEALDALGIIQGTECGTGRFCPDEPIERWVMAVWLVRAVDHMDEPAAVPGRFSDMDEEAWWSGYVERLAELGISQGCGTNPPRFCASGAVTRGEMASFLTRAFALEPAEDAGFSDLAGTVHTSNIDSAVAAGLVSGCSGDPLRFCPDEPVTRVEMVTFLARAIGLAPPAIYEETVEEHGILHLIARYTTYHDCCEPRVTNLQLFSDTVTGTVVQPGERLSLNTLVGRRTTEKGYLPADTWVVDRVSDSVGGGISQYAATMYNTIFWGGFIGSSYRPHSVYISRYPPGIEGTLDYPYIDLVFRNDTDSPVLVVSDYTDTSLTVELYGDNDGRAVTGEWKDGWHALEVLTPGGPDARVVNGQVSRPYRYVDPPPTRYISNPDLGIGETIVIEPARKGWTVRIDRTVTVNGEDRDQSWWVSYRSVRAIIEAHPCVISNSCPPEEEPFDEGDEDGNGDREPQPV
ncbi:MAG: VanW family protein [bacterium]|nr:VanW family protein [bacterium]